MFLSSSGDLFQWGYQDNGVNMKLPVKVEYKFQANDPVKDVIITNSFVVILLRSGALLGYGANKMNILGGPNVTQVERPIKIRDFFEEIESQIQIVDVAASDTSIVLLTRGGVVYVREDSSRSCRLLNELGESVYDHVPFDFLDNQPALAVSTTNSFSSIVTEKGIFMWGDNESGQLGQGINNYSTCIHHPVRVFTDHIPNLRSAIKVVHGTSHSIAVFQSCGINYVGPDCEIPVCYGIPANDSEVCLGHGSCSGPNKCECTFLWMSNSGDEKMNCSRVSNLFAFIIVMVIVVPLICLLLFVCCFSIPLVVKQTKARLVEMEMKAVLNERLLSDDGNEHFSGEADLISYNQLKFLNKISEGAFGVVFKGVYRETKVAIKQMKDEGYKQTQFNYEVGIMKEMRHPNIVLFMGVCRYNNYRLIISELMEGGSLEDLIHNKKERSVAPATRHFCMTLEQKISILKDICRGMIYLHNMIPPLLHLDLKPSNCLLDKRKEFCKICDFGTTRHLSTQTMTGNVGTLLYMSPEVMREERFSTKSDVFSFSILMHELFFERSPYSTNKSAEEDSLLNMLGLGIQILSGRRPDTSIDNPTSQEDQCIRLMETCWNHDPAQRPSFVEILETMENWH
ncbi:serine/threonine-protein kinase [Acrasis kona]|uniref:Serine/threonine-protein kinase n=1 Tax=Acrasis kona TaxID=1008807 RepID=A0AAW2Z142_9EUKA